MLPQLNKFVADQIHLELAEIGWKMHRFLSNFDRFDNAALCFIGLGSRVAEKYKNP